MAMIHGTTIHGIHGTVLTGIVHTVGEDTTAGEVIMADGIRPGIPVGIGHPIMVGAMAVITEDIMEDITVAIMAVIMAATVVIGEIHIIITGHTAGTSMDEQLLRAQSMNVMQVAGLSEPARLRRKEASHRLIAGALPLEAVMAKQVAVLH